MNELVIRHVHALVKDKSLVVTAETPLIGDLRVLDSLGLVELCLKLEDEASTLGFEFDWTSESAMSRSRSMFRTVATLTEEFQSQFKSST
jgi:acyl carrier protein